MTLSPKPQVERVPSRRHRKFDMRDAVSRWCGMRNTSRRPSASHQSMRLGAVLVGLVFVSGCQTLSNINNPFTSDSLAERPEDESIDHIRGPLQRTLHSKQSAEVDNSVFQANYEQGKQHFDSGELERAEEQFKIAAGENRNWLQRANFGSRLLRRRSDKDDVQPKTRLREDALFMIAETQFAQERYAKAQDSYVLLLKEYPSTAHLDETTQRLFTIAKNWLGSPEFVTTSEVQQVNLEDPRSTPPAEQAEFPHSAILVPNFRDRSRPVFDTPGRALQALREIWLNDPTGPLADDALMLTATYHLRTGDFPQADRFLTMLRDEYPDSPHLQTAFVLGSHVKLMSYQGAAYDGTKLNDAVELKESTLRLFPELPERALLESELARIEVDRAARDWERVIFYQKKNKPKSIAVYCREIIKDYPQSPYATQARALLAELGPEYFRRLPVEERQRIEGMQQPTTTEIVEPSTSAEPEPDPISRPPRAFPFDNRYEELPPPAEELVPESQQRTPRRLPFNIGRLLPGRDEESTQ